MPTREAIRSGLPRRARAWVWAEVSWAMGVGVCVCLGELGVQGETQVEGNEGIGVDFHQTSACCPIY
jgi:hypothetical protein